MEGSEGCSSAGRVPLRESLLRERFCCIADACIYAVEEDAEEDDVAGLTTGVSG